MKAWMAALSAKMAMWLMRQLVGYVKSETPERAMWARRLSKNRILNDKAKAAETATEVDDIGPLGAYTYMGFATMQQAQRCLGDALANIGEMSFDTEKAREKIREAIRILDESE